MVTLPTDFVQTKYPGYFWNLKTRTLYSVKVTGELKPLKFRPASFWQNIPGYEVSHKGQRFTMPLSYLERLVPSKSEFPIWQDDDS